MSRILEETNRIGAGQHLLLNGYPCYLWLPGQQPDQELRLQLDYPSDVEWRCWRWLDDQPPTLQWQRRETASKLTASLAMPAELTGQLIGHLVMIRASCLDPQTHWQTIELSALSSDTSTR